MYYSLYDLSYFSTNSFFSSTEVIKYVSLNDFQTLFYVKESFVCGNMSFTVS